MNYANMYMNQRFVNVGHLKKCERLNVTKNPHMEYPHLRILLF